MKKVPFVAATVIIILSACYALGVFGVDSLVRVEEKQFSEFAFSGYMKNGLFDGIGTIHFDNGEVFSGNFSQGRFDGEGVFIDSSDSVIYFGQFRDGLFHGHGVYYSSEGWRYEGEFQDGLFHGQGVITAPSGQLHGYWEMGVLIRHD